MERWTDAAHRELLGAMHRGEPSTALALLRTHPPADTAHTVATWLIGAVNADVAGARWVAMAIVDELAKRYLQEDLTLASRLQHALDGTEPPDLALIPVDMFILSELLEGGLSYDTGHRLHVETGQILSEDPEGIEGLPEPPDWDDERIWLPFDEIWPRQGWQDMADFIDTVDDPALAERLSNAIRGRGAFRYFKDIVYSTEHEGFRWGLFSDEREAGRARHWLAEHGLRPD